MVARSGALVGIQFASSKQIGDCGVGSAGQSLRKGIQITRRKLLGAITDAELDLAAVFGRYGRKIKRGVAGIRVARTWSQDRTVVQNGAACYDARAGEFGSAADGHSPASGQASCNAVGPDLQSACGHICGTRVAIRSVHDQSACRRFGERAAAIELTEVAQRTGFGDEHDFPARSANAVAAQVQIRATKGECGVFRARAARADDVSRHGDVAARQGNVGRHCAARRCIGHVDRGATARADGDGAAGDIEACCHRAATAGVNRHDHAANRGHCRTCTLAQINSSRGAAGACGRPPSHGQRVRHQAALIKTQGRRGGTRSARAIRQRQRAYQKIGSVP